MVLLSRGGSTWGQRTSSMIPDPSSFSVAMLGEEYNQEEGESTVKKAHVTK